MPTTPQHIIRRQFLHVELFGSESDGLALQRRLPELCRLTLLPALDRVLERAAPAQGQLRIERLAVDAGVVSLATLEGDLVDAVTQAVEKQLREQIGAATSLDGSQPAKIHLRSDRQSVDEGFVFFLHTGSLPWWFRLPAGRSLEQVIVDAWQQARSPDTDPGTLKAAIVDAIGLDSVRKRLTTQFSATFLEGLLAKLSPQGLEAIREVCVRLENAAVTASAGQRFARQVWQSAFAGLAEGEIRSARSLVAASWDSLAAAERQVFGLADWLERDWPGAINASATDARSRPGSVSPNHLRLARSSMPTVNRPLPASEAVAGQPATVTDQSSLSGGVSSGHTGHAESPARRATKSTPSVSLDESASSPTGRSVQEKSETTVAVDPTPYKGSQALRSADSDGENAWQPAAETEHVDSRDQGAPRSRQAQAGESGVSLRPATALVPRARIDLTEGVYVDCAGVILLHPFLPRFFETLGIADNDQIVQPERALCLLHFLATGQSIAPEHALLLPKLLCNVPVETAVESNVNLTASEMDEANALLEAVIGHWEALRNTTPDGLRGSFLTRPGKISQRADGDYLLQVESQSFDMLLDRLPWGFGLVKLPWMESMVWVEWEH